MLICSGLTIFEAVLYNQPLQMSSSARFAWALNFCPPPFGRFRNLPLPAADNQDACATTKK